MKRELLITIYVRFSILAALCFVGCALGLLALYLQGYPMQGAIPWPITAFLSNQGKSFFSHIFTQLLIIAALSSPIIING